MKKVFILIFCTMYIFGITFNAKASNIENSLDSREASEILVPFADEHIMTREEAMIALSKIIGINDNKMSRWMFVTQSDHFYYEDIKYNSYKGRTLDLAMDIFGKYSHPTKCVFYFRTSKFYGEEPASVADVLSWMLNVLYLSTNEYKGAENLKECANDVGLIDSEEYISSKMQAKTFKKIIERFLNCVVYQYLDDTDFSYIKYNIIRDGENTIYEDANLKYIDIFNKTYKDKNIYIKNDGIYLENEKILLNGEQPFVDENGIYFMPIRWFANFFGFDNVEWDESKQEVTLQNYKLLKNTNIENDFNFIFTNQIAEYYCGNKKCDIDTAPKIIDDVFYIPMRDVFDSLVYNVIWCK